MGFACNLISQYALFSLLDPREETGATWERYRPMLYWVVTVWLGLALMLPTNLLLKWVLVGKRRPGRPVRDGPWQAAADWYSPLFLHLLLHMGSC
jgi:hypothetical protein